MGQMSTAPSWISTISYDQTESPAEFGLRLRKSLRSNKAVHITNVDPDRVDLGIFYDEVSETVGRSYCTSEDSFTGDRTGEKWISIRYDPTIRNRYRHSRTGQPLHTDGSYESHSPDLGFIYCVRQARTGGGTLLLDSEDLVAVLKKQDARLYRQLVSTPIRFSKASDSKTRPVIDMDRDGVVLTWNYFCVDESAPAEAKQLAESFFVFLNTQLIGSELIVPIGLGSGDALAWHDERLLHGRNSFRAERAGERFLWKTSLSM